MPKLWRQTIQAHRREVRDAILDTTAALVAQHGLRAVTMSQIAGETGIGRATLYKYFSGVEPILIAWHERHVTEHLEHLASLRDQPGDVRTRLASVLEVYALIAFERHQHLADLRALVHQREHVAGSERRLVDIVEGLLTEAVGVRAIRADVPPGELAAFCVHALEAAGAMPSKGAARRLATVVLDALDPDQAKRVRPAQP
ncbi:MAG: TetR/AcrR family transcriptional regulator, partial [Chloroflexota bacterium]|nr:TetR/AcrR family transcriptional regulator [Chloroflexota bacterium]